MTVEKIPSVEEVNGTDSPMRKRPYADTPDSGSMDETALDLVSLYHAVPELLSTDAIDASVDPATQPIEQWKGEAQVRFAPTLTSRAQWSATVQVAHTRLYLTLHTEPTVGLALDYRAIFVHALQTAETEESGVPALYLQLGVNLAHLVGSSVKAILKDQSAAEQAERESEGESEDEEELGFSELWIIPEDSSLAEDLFSALSTCASMHPDMLEDDDEDADFEQPFLSANMEDLDASKLELSEEGEFHAARFEVMLAAQAAEASKGQFEDVEEEERP